MDKHKINFALKTDCLQSNKFKRDNIQLFLRSDFKKNLNKYVINSEQQEKINASKNEIDQYYNMKQWDKIKKFTNPYELIYITNKKRRQFSISTYEPLSRSYFKMLEICKEFFQNKIEKSEPIKTVHLAEGPGGFIEGIVNIRKNINDTYYGITLIDKNKEIPGWKRSTLFLKKNPNVEILYGYDNTGNLYNTNNHKFLQYKMGTESEKADIVTADGGFDFSIDYNLQEFLANKLIFAQIIAAFGVQKIGGDFVCKFFDTISKVSCDILHILILFYDEVIFFKPYTSRPANSEKYVVCKGFKGISARTLQHFRSILNIWNNIEDNNIFIVSLLRRNNTSIINQLININTKLQEEQILYINKTINLIKIPYNNYNYLENQDKQIQNASYWCEKYEI